MNPPATDMESLGKRLSRLERENRWLKRIGGITLLGVAAVVLMGQAAPRKVTKVIEAEEFILRDGTGKVRARLGSAADGSPGLELLDEKENARAVLGHSALEYMRTNTIVQRPASSLVLFDKDGNVMWKAP